MNLWAIFLTGLFVGGLSCLAVQGGLLAATIAQREEEKLKEELINSKKKNLFTSSLPILSFLGAKLIAYTILGFLLGWFGSLFQLSGAVQIILQFFVVIFMIGTALNILNVHPIFRYFAIQPPHFLTRLIRKQSKSSNIFAPLTLGAFTVFIPCGTTQAMMALAIASGKPLIGATILLVFILGTSPVFFTLGFIVTQLGDALKEKFMKVAAYLIILLALFNLNNTLALTGSSFTLDNIWKNFTCTISFCSASTQDGGSEVSGPVVNEETINIESAGYTPNSFNVKRGSKVTLKLTNTTGNGCVQAFTIPSLGVRKIVPVGTSDTIVFTAPSEPGQLPFMCSMGMYRGIINVI